MEVKGFEVEGVIKVDNVRIYGLNESVIASGYPMQIETHDMNKVVIGEKDLKRVKHLGNAVSGRSHPQGRTGPPRQYPEGGQFSEPSARRQSARSGGKGLL